MKTRLGIYAEKVVLFVMKRNPSEPGSFDELMHWFDEQLLFDLTFSVSFNHAFDSLLSLCFQIFCILDGWLMQLGD